MLSPDPTNPYANYSGTRNTLNFSQPHVRKMVMDSLRYWKNEMHIDGFRFDLASVFSRNADGSLNWGDAPIFSEIAADPELGRLSLIAEPWELAVTSSVVDSREPPGCNGMRVIGTISAVLSGATREWSRMSCVVFMVAITYFLIVRTMPTMPSRQSTMSIATMDSPSTISFLITTNTT